MALSWYPKALKEHMCCAAPQGHDDFWLASCCDRIQTCLTPISSANLPWVVFIFCFNFKYILKGYFYFVRLNVVFHAYVAGMSAVHGGQGHQIPRSWRTLDWVLGPSQISQEQQGPWLLSYLLSSLFDVLFSSHLRLYPQILTQTTHKLKSVPLTTWKFIRKYIWNTGSWLFLIKITPGTGEMAGQLKGLPFFHRTCEFGYVGK